MGALNDAFRVETFTLQADHCRLLGWAHTTAAWSCRTWRPARLDYVFRATDAS